MSIDHQSAPSSPGLWNEADLWPRRDEPEVREEIATRFLPFAKSIALRYRSSAEPFDDLIQVANLGLMNAIDRFDPESGHPFTAFASATINGELKRHFRDRVSSVRLPRGVYERVGRAEIATSELRGSLGREPSNEEIAEAADCSPDQVEEAQLGVAVRHPVPLQTDDDEVEGSGILEDHVGVEDPDFGLAEDRMLALNVLEKLEGDDRTIIVLRYRDELSQSEIADRLGCSQMQISRRLRKILDELNEWMVGNRLARS